MIRYLNLIGLSLLLILGSCQSNKKSVNEYQIDTLYSDISNTEIEIVQEPEWLQNDTLSVQDRFVENDSFHSHIKLDFALMTANISDTSQLRMIDKVCAISVIPDTTWINRQQNEMGDDWNEVVSDIQYYEYLAKDTLEKLNIPTFFAPREKRFIKFIKSDHSSFTIDLTKMEDAWGLILFNGEDNPVLWSSTDIDSEIKEIFKK